MKISSRTESKSLQQPQIMKSKSSGRHKDNSAHLEVAMRKSPQDNKNQKHSLNRGRSDRLCGTVHERGVVELLLFLTERLG
jgi:hypothetical protein